MLSTSFSSSSVLVSTSAGTPRSVARKLQVEKRRSSGGGEERPGEEGEEGKGKGEVRRTAAEGGGLESPSASGLSSLVGSGVLEPGSLSMRESGSFGAQANGGSGEDFLTPYILGL